LIKLAIDLDVTTAHAKPPELFEGRITLRPAERDDSCDRGRALFEQSKVPFVTLRMLMPGVLDSGIDHPFDGSGRIERRTRLNTLIIVAVVSKFGCEHLSFLPVLIGTDHFFGGVNGETAFIGIRPILCPLDRSCLPRKGGDDAMVTASDERQIVDDVVTGTSSRLGS
jgi:hypothetical protein